MSLNRRNPRRDKNEAEIIAALEAAGCSVTRLSGRGVPDLLIGRGYTSWWLAEVKTAKGCYTPDQMAWLVTWKGPRPLCLRTVDEALKLVGVKGEGAA